MLERWINVENTFESHIDFYEELIHPLISPPCKSNVKDSLRAKEIIYNLASFRYIWETRSVPVKMVTKNISEMIRELRDLRQILVKIEHIFLFQEQKDFVPISRQVYERTVDIESDIHQIKLSLRRIIFDEMGAIATSQPSEAFSIDLEDYFIKMSISIQTIFDSIGTSIRSYKDLQNQKYIDQKFLDDDRMYVATIDSKLDLTLYDPLMDLIKECSECIGMIYTQIV